MDKKKNDLVLSFEWHSVLRDVLVNAWTVVLAAAIGVLAVYIAQQSLYTPVYKSEATLWVSTTSISNNAFTSSAQSKEIASVLSTVFTQPSVKEKACEYAGANFRGEVTSTVIEGTNFVKLTVSDSDPQNAFMFLKSILASYHQVSDNIFTTSVIKILTNPTISASSTARLSNSWRWRVGLIMGFLALCVIVFFSMIRDTVKSKNEFIKKIDADLLGTIPHERKSKNLKQLFKKNRKALLIDDSLAISLMFSENYQHIANKLRHLKQQTGNKVFAITSLMENEGKSTVVANIAISLAHNGYKVLLMDLDFKKPAMYKIFKKEARKDTEVADLLSGKVLIEDYTLRSYKKTTISLAVNTSSHRDEQKYLEAERIREIVNYYRDSFDFIIFDTAPMMFDADVTNILPVVDAAIFTIRTDTAETAALNEALRTIKNTGGKLAGCILNDTFSEFFLFGQMGHDEKGYYANRYQGYGKYGNRSYGHYEKYESNDDTVMENDAKVVNESDIEEINLAALTEEKGSADND